MTENEQFCASLRRYLSAGYPLVCLVTHEEQRALELVRSLVPSHAVPRWSCAGGLDLSPETAELTDPLKALAYVTQQGPSGIYVFADLHPFLKEPRVVRALREFAQQALTLRKALVLITPSPELPTELEKEMAVLDLPLPSAEELSSLLEQEKKRRPNGHRWELEPLVRAAQGLTGLEAQRAFRLALGCGSDSEALTQIVTEKRRVLRSAASLELVPMSVGLQDIGGLEMLKAWLKARVPAFQNKARAFGLPEPRGMLVCGVQGCGKSLVAKAASAVFGLPLVRLDFAVVFAAPSPELAFRQALRVTEAIAPVVLWVDEIEKGLAGAGLDSRYGRVFGDFLVWLQEKRAAVFVAATANEVDQLPPELARRGRFDDIFFVDLPAAKEREEILAIHLRRRGRDPSRYPLAALTKPLESYSGAELEQIVVAGLFRAYAAGRDLDSEDLRVAASEMIPLATMYEEKVQALRTWAQARARRASADRRTLELFED